MAESLDELKRLAYGRSDDPDAAARAQRELAELAAPPVPLEPPPLPRTRTITTGALAALLTAALLLSVIATVIALRPPSSLTVFDRAQTARELEPPEMVSVVSRETEGAGLTYTAGSSRLLKTSGANEIWAWRDGEGQICLGIFSNAVGSSSCTDESEFAVRGLEIGVGGLGIGMESTSVHWGPTGDPVVTVGFAGPR